MPSDFRTAVAVLRKNHERLAEIVADLADEDLEAESYCSEWNIAQVLSHLGSGSEIARLNLQAAVLGDAPLERSDYQMIWDRWNAMGPREMADSFLGSVDDYLALADSIEDDVASTLEVASAGGRFVDPATAVLTRLYEHALHRWDVEVALEGDAAIPGDAVELLVDRLADRTGRLARGERPGAAPISIGVVTHGPERQLLLEIGEEVTLGEGSGGSGRLESTAEGLLLLLSGRLDSQHTPSEISTDGPVSLDELRVLFPGN